MTEGAELQAFLAGLKGLPFVRKAHLRVHPRHEVDALLDLEAPDGRHQFLVEVKRAPHLNHALLDQILARATRDKDNDWIVFAPYVTPQFGEQLAAKGIAYLDQQGNCHLAIGDRYLAHVEGRKPHRIARPRPLRPGAYQVMFALLARPELVAKPVRQIAEIAAVPRATVGDVLLRLMQDGIIGTTARGRRLLEPRRLLERWLVGYGDVLRPALVIGRYQTPFKEPPELEEALRDVLGAENRRWAFGGEAAAFRLTGHYRGETTTVYCDGANPLPARLRALRAEDGHLVVLRAPGPLTFKGEKPETAHPLLVYAELMTGGRERAREAGAGIRDQYLRAFV